MSVVEGVKGFSVNYRDEYGRRKQIFVGSNAAAQAVDAKIAQQVSAARAKLRTFTATADLTLLALAELWEAKRDCVGPWTRKKDKFRLAHFCRQHGTLLATEITPAMVDEFLRLRQNELAPWSLYQTHRSLRSLFDWAREEGIIPSSPVPRVPKAPPPSRKGFAMSREQESELLAAATRRARLLCLLALDAGLAGADCSALRLHQIDLDHQVLTYTRLKTKVPVVVPLTDRLLVALAVHTSGATHPDARLFRFSQTTGTQGALSTLRTRVFFHFTHHDLRHTFISRVAATGCRWRIVQVLAGHAPQTPTEKYDHPSLDELRRVIAAIEKGERLYEKGRP